MSKDTSRLSHLLRNMRQCWKEFTLLTKSYESYGMFINEICINAPFYFSPHLHFDKLAFFHQQIINSSRQKKLVGTMDDFPSYTFFLSK